jgi:hypothetical protein
MWLKPKPQEREADALRKATLTFTQSLQAGIGGLRARVIDPHVLHKCATHFAVKPLKTKCRNQPVYLNGLRQPQL